MCVVSACKPIKSTVCSQKHVEYILDLDAMMIGRQSWCNHKSLLSFLLMAAMLSKLIVNTSQKFPPFSVPKTESIWCECTVCNICILMCVIWILLVFLFVFLSPTGCPLYGQQQWSGRKLWCCRIGLWVSAPLLILLIALIVFLVILIALPAGVGYKVYTSCCKSKKACRIWSTVTAVLITLLFSPIVSVVGALAVLPVGYIYVYCVIPVHLLWTNTH